MYLPLLEIIYIYCIFVHIISYYIRINLFKYSVYSLHRRARLLKRKMSIIIFHLLTRKTNFLFSFSVCRKQTGVCCFCSPFSVNKLKLPFSINSVFLNINYIYCIGSINIYTVDVNIDIDIDIYVYICIYICMYIYAAVSKKKRKPRRKYFLNLFSVYSSSKQNYVICPIVDKETNGSYQRIERTKRTCPSMMVWHTCGWKLVSSLNAHSWRWNEIKTLISTVISRSGLCYRAGWPMGLAELTSQSASLQHLPDQLSTHQVANHPVFNTFQTSSQHTR